MLLLPVLPEHHVRTQALPALITCMHCILLLELLLSLRGRCAAAHQQDCSFSHERMRIQARLHCQ
jgi:hypothetical protein